MFQLHTSNGQMAVGVYPPPLATKVRDWCVEAMAAYRQAEAADRSSLGRELAARVLALTGQLVEPGAIQVDRQSQTASVAVGTAWFRLRRGELCLVRTCVYCGVDRLESAAIQDQVDLGHALSIWEPRCEECGVEDEDWTYSF